MLRPAAAQLATRDGHRRDDPARRPAGQRLEPRRQLGHPVCARRRKRGRWERLGPRLLHAVAGCTAAVDRRASRRNRDAQSTSTRVERLNMNLAHATHIHIAYCKSACRSCIARSRCCARADACRVRRSRGSFRWPTVRRAAGRRALTDRAARR